MNPANFRIGFGHDTHRLIEGGPLLLGGIEIPFEKSLDGHSDADVLLHAVTDAVLGAAALGDIGELFPDSAAVNSNRSSVEMLQLAMEKVRSIGFEIVNIDCTVFAQRPKLSQFKTDITKSIASALEVESGLVNVKAKTGEGVGEVGSETCMKSLAVALLYRENENG